MAKLVMAQMVMAQIMLLFGRVPFNSWKFVPAYARWGEARAATSKKY
jgi:hypothetical protein